MKILSPRGWKAPVGYANGVAASGTMVFVAGQVGWNEHQVFASENIAPQFRQALKNVLAILAEAGGRPEHVCRVTAYCCDKTAYLAARGEVGGLVAAIGGDAADMLGAPARFGEDREDVLQGLPELRRDILGGEDLVLVPAHLAGNEDHRARGGDAVRVADGRFPAARREDLHGASRSCAAGPGPRPSRRPAAAPSSSIHG